MESKINYTVVGLFVVILVTGLISFVFWLGKHGGEQKYDYYRVYISESVAGLTVDASVKYRGVDVGRVQQIRLNPKNSEQVELTLQIEHNTPVKTDSTATLKSYGLTGLAYVELAGGSTDAPPLAPNNKDYPIIAATPSLFTQAYQSIGGLTEKSLVALDKFNRLLSDKNLTHFAEILVETKLLMQTLRKQTKNIKRLVSKGIIMEDKITNAFKKVEAASISVKKMSDNLDNNTSQFSQQISQDLRQSLLSFHQLMQQLKNLSTELQHTTQEIGASPSDLLFKSTQPKPGPGEEGYHEQ